MYAFLISALIRFLEGLHSTAEWICADAESDPRLWNWMLGAARNGDREAVGPLARHAWTALRFALNTWRDRASLRVGVCVVAWMAVVAITGGLPESRRALHPLPFRDADRLILISQGPPVLGVRLGFLEKESAAFESATPALASVASYAWYTARWGSREISAANVSPNFFSVLGVNVPPGSLYVSSTFSRKQLNGATSGTFDFSGSRWKLAGVLPKEFVFLNPNVEVWTIGNKLNTGPAEQWWRRLEGTVARLAPTARVADVEQEVRAQLVSASLLRKNFRVIATPLEEYSREGASSLLRDFLCALAALALFTLYRATRERAWKYWLYFFAKVGLPLLTLSLFALEYGSSGRFWATQLLGTWMRVVVMLGVVLWAWRDQSSRCRVCLSRMSLPVRMGMRGRVLLEEVGEEWMCREGHGSLYSAESVLGAEMGNRWFRWV